MPRVDQMKELNQEAQIARDAGRILLSYFGSDLLTTESKGPRDLVTAADLAAEQCILAALTEAFPGDGVVGEEGTNTATTTGRRWYVDPLDGTMNFSQEIPFWCVSIALYQESGAVIGVVHDPIRDETFRAVSGLGAWCNERRIRCSGPERLADAFVHITIDFNERSLLEGLEDVRAVAPRVLRTRNMGSAALALAYVAAGRFDAMLHRSAHTWDYAGGAALILEAGGVVSDLDARPFSESSVSMVAAANAGLHAELLDLIRLREAARINSPCNWRDGIPFSYARAPERLFRSSWP